MSRSKKTPARIITMLLAALMLCVMLPVNIFAADTTLTVKIGILYLSDEFNAGYDADWQVGTEYFSCTMSTTCKGGDRYEAHSVAYSDIATVRNNYKNQVRDGYEIVGWCCVDTPSKNVQYWNVWSGNGGATFYPGRTIYLVAKQPVENYTLSYNANGGTGAPADQTAGGQGSATFTVSNTVPTHEGYTFKGWAESASATTAAYQAGSQITISANTTLYAVWEEVEVETFTYTLSYNGGEGAENVPAAQTSEETTETSWTTTVSATTPTKEGFTFEGWALNDEATEVEYAAGADITITADTTLYAVWTEDEEVIDPEPSPDPGEDEDKVSVPGIDKKNGEKDELGTVAPGTVFNFTLNSHIGEDMTDAVITHQNGDYEGTYNLVFHDDMENLTFVEGSLSVKVGETTLNADQYTVNFQCEDDCDFEVTIDCVALLNAKVFDIEDAGAVTVQVAYQGKVSDKAEDDIVIKNTAWVNDSAKDVLDGIVDDKIPTPPATGGNGTMMYTILGIVLMGGAAVAFALTRKKRSAR